MAMPRFNKPTKVWKAEDATGHEGSVASDKARGTWKWVEQEKGRCWTSALIPNGDFIVARVQRSLSKGKDGLYSYYAYRNAKVLGMRKDVEAAQRLAHAGKEERGDGLDRVVLYVDNHPGEVPPFLALTEAERRAVRAQYPYAAPPPRAAERAEAKGVLPVLPSAKRTPVEPAGAVSAQGTIVWHAAKGNPKRPGSGAHARWQLLKEHGGSTVAAFLKAGGNPKTLENALRDGYVKVTP